MARKGRKRGFSLWARFPGEPFQEYAVACDEAACRDWRRTIKTNLARQGLRLPLSWLILPPGEMPYLEPQKP